MDHKAESFMSGSIALAVTYLQRASHAVKTVDFGGISHPWHFGASSGWSLRQANLVCVPVCRFEGLGPADSTISRQVASKGG